VRARRSTPPTAARIARLHHTTDDRAGITRHKARSGFDYRRSDGSLCEIWRRCSVEGFVGTGRVSQAVVAIDEAPEHSERNEERWCLAELLRIKGELLLIQGVQHAAGMAEDLFLKALDWARRQGALSWELRAATPWPACGVTRGEPTTHVS
jgi:hypothetical protein